VPLAFIPVFLSTVGAPVAQDKGHEGLFLGRLHSITDRMGRSGVAPKLFYEWPEYEKEAVRLVDQCERLYQSFVTAGGKSQQ
jgi:hypothetical protein